VNKQRYTIFYLPTSSFNPSICQTGS